MSKKVIIVEAFEEYSDCHDCGGCHSEPYIRIVDSTQEVAKSFANEFANNHFAMEELLKNRQFLDALDKCSFRNVKEIKDTDEKIIAEKRYYLHDNSNRMPILYEIDFNNLSESSGISLASDKYQILQLVSKESLKEIAPVVYKKMKDTQKRLKATAETKKRKAQERAAKKKEEEIAAARALLEREGKL